MDSFKAKMFGGYDKKTTLEYVDMLNIRIHRLEIMKKEGKEGEDAYTLQPLKYPEEVIKKAKMGGFNEKEVDEFIEEATAKIKELERELKIRG